MHTTQLLVRLPDDLVRRFRRRVAVRERSKFIQRLLEDALPSDNFDDNPLYRAAIAVEQDPEFNAEMGLWEQAAAADGLGNAPIEKRTR